MKAFTIEQKKAYLRSYRMAERRACDIEEEISQLRENKMHPSVRLGGQPGGNGSADLSNYAARLDELIRKLNDEKNKALSLRIEIEQNIDKMVDSDEKAILRYRYIRGMTWPKIAERINYSERHTQRIYERAIRNFMS